MCVVNRWVDGGKEGGRDGWMARRIDKGAVFVDLLTT